jgi:hypothetical protein
MKRLLLVVIFIGLWRMAHAQSKNMQSVADSLHAVTPLRTFIAPPHSGKVIVAPDFHAQGLGFFCKQELRLEKAHVPVVFRLGSVPYCNMLEQKPGYKQ